MMKCRTLNVVNCGHKPSNMHSLYHFVPPKKFQMERLFFSVPLISTCVYKYNQCKLKEMVCDLITIEEIIVIQAIVVKKRSN